MRIAMVSEHASPLATLGGADAGGQNVHVAALSGALADLGHEVEVYTRRDAPDLPERVEMRPGVTVVHVPAGPAREIPKDDLLPWMRDFGAWLADRWAQAPPDVVHAHFWMSGLAALQASRSLARPVPVTQTFHALGSVKRRHQGDRDTSPPGRVEAEAGIGRGVDVVIATCSDEVTELSRLGVPASRITVVPCGVDVEHFRPVEERPTSASVRRRYRLLSIGRMVERKGVDTVIRALVDLPDVELVVAGGPAREDLPEDAEYRRLVEVAHEVRVSDRVEFVGRVGRDEVPRVLRDADVVVTTPWYEPFGIVPLEAAACARPVVGSAVGGLLDTVQHGVTGLLVSPRDPAALAEAVRELLLDPVRRRRFGETARRMAVERYGWARVARDTEDVYADLVGTVARVEAG